MPLGFVAAGIEIYSGIEGMNNAKKSGDHAEYRANRIFEEQQGYATMLDELMKNPEKIVNTPGYAFGLEQGSQSLARTNAANGFLNSGKAAVELTQYGQDYAFKYLDQHEKLLASLSGLTTQNPEDAARTGISADKQWSDSADSLTTSLGGMGQVLNSYFAPA